MNTNEIYDYLIDYEIATEEEVKLVCCINGYNEEALNSILFARTAYRSIEQLQECEQ